MRKFLERSSWSFCEKQVIEVATGNCYTLTQPKRLFSEDGYSVLRTVAVQNTEAPEKDFYVYEISYMPDGYSLCIVHVDEETAETLIKNNLQAFMRGDARECIVKYFAKKER